MTPDIERIRPQVLGVARRLCPSREDAEDIAQEALIKAWRHAPSHPLPYALRCVATIRVDRARKASRRVKTAPINEQIAADPFADEVDERETLRRVDAQMPEALQGLLLLEWAGYTQQEIGEMLGISKQAANRRLAKARRLAQEMLEG